MKELKFVLGVAALLGAAGTTTCLATPGDTIRVSEAFGGGGGDDGADNGYWSAISPDGRYSAFASYASNLVPPGVDTNFGQDVFMRDNVTGVTTLVSAEPGGGQHAGSSYCNAPTVSGDGQWVCFDTDGAFAAFPGDTNVLPDVYLKNTVTGALTWVSREIGGGASLAGQSYSSWVSNDGAYIAFESSSEALVAGDANGFSDIFRYHIPSGAMELASTSAAGVQGDGGSIQAGISADGRYICFDSTAENLAPDGNALGDVFRKDMTSGAVVIGSVPLGGGANAGNQTLNHGMSHDGNRVCFLSNDPTLSAPDGRRNGVVRDIAAGITIIASVADGGVNIAGGTIGSIGLSPDGGYFSWRGSGQFVAADPNDGLNDVFVCELATGRVQNGSPAAGGGFQVTGTMAFTIPSSGGTYVQYASNASDLIANDTDLFYDIFRYEYSWGDPCDPDVNQDGNVDQDDVSYLINVVGGGDNPTGIDPDFNQDGNVDQDDIAALINTVGGGGCP
jgi:hypothetical protein